MKLIRIIRSSIGLLFSFEFIFVVFLFAGVYKKNPKMAWVPVDLTVASFGLSVIIGIFLLFKNGWGVNKKILRLLAMFSLFFSWALLSLAWSKSWNYGSPKAVHLAVLGFWSIFGCAVIIGQDKDRLQRFCASLVVLSLWLAIEVVIHIADGTLLKEWDFASNYLGLGRLLGLSVLVLVGLLLWGHLRLFNAILVGLLMVFLVSILMIAGGRGPFLATLVALIIPAVCDVRFSVKSILVRKNLLIFSGLLGVVLVWFITIGNQFFGYTTIDRLWVLVEGGGGSSAHYRVWFFSKAYEFWMEAPVFGHGIGEFGSLLGWGDIRVYPHNLFLEIMVELGLVGLALILLAVYSTLSNFSFRLLRSDYFLALLVMFVLNAFINGMVSGDLSDNRILLALLGLYAGRSVMPMRTYDDVVAY